MKEVIENNKEVDLDNMSKEELEEQQDYYTNLANRYYNYEQSIKNILNSIYGAFGNQWFYFFNINIAESITLQGQDAILYTEKMLNLYFNKYWHKDTEIHKKMGISLKGEVSKPVVIYIDTDSVAADSKVIINNEESTIEEMFRNYSKINGFHVSQKGDEIIKSPNCTILNHSKKRGLYNVPVEKIIRHKVTKKKWRLRTKSGKEVIVTNDHSLIILRDGKQMKVTASEINPKYDKVISIYKDIIANYKSEIEEIESCECIGEFEDEYVYDIEVNDETHTFIANDILVHNSCYVTFEEVLDKCDWEGTEKDFIMKLYKLRIEQYLVKVLKRYSDGFGTENFLSFDMESIAKNAIWLAKKKYIQNLAWTDPDIHFEDLTNIKVKGWQTVQASTPVASREILSSALHMVFENDVIKMDEIVKFLKEKKQQFKLEDNEDICLNLRMNHYDKYVIDDMNQLELAKGAGPNVKGASFHNYLLNNSKHKNKYEILTSGERLKIYHTDDPRCEVFAYSAGKFPYEFAPNIDYEIQYEKTVIDPLNKVLQAIGLQTLNRNLMYARSLF